MWELEVPKPSYIIQKKVDDTLRVIMIGDSWAEKMHLCIGDTILRDRIAFLVGEKVSFESRGRGGEKSRGIYDYIFLSDYPGTRLLMSSSPDYCIILAGINDAAANLGTKQFVHHYHLILNFLLNNNIKPVIVEIPDVKIWNLYSQKPIKDFLSDFLRSTMTGSGMYDFSGYRHALNKMLIDEQLMDSVVFVPMSCWNDCSPEIDRKLFDEDLIHLNNNGYNKLCLCIAEAISIDLKDRVYSTFSNEPMGKNAHCCAKNN